MTSSPLPEPLKKVWMRNEAQAARLARREVVLTARARGVPEEVIERLELCTSEVVTNVIVHAPGSTLRLVLTRTQERLRVEAHDTSDRRPHGLPADPYGESGRGLFLVASYADDHGVYATHRGKAVWFEVVAWPDKLDRWTGT